MYKSRCVIDLDEITRDTRKFNLMCKDKKSYETEPQARWAAGEFSRIRGVYMRVYKCPYCNKFHITKSKR